MTKLEEHPTVVRHRRENPGPPPTKMEVERLRQICRGAGADDFGFVAFDRPELDDQRAEIQARYPWARTLISVVVRMNREPIRSPARSVANLEFHHTDEEADEVGRRIVRALESEGIRAVNPSVGFPMEMDRFPGKVWVVSHKPVAEAAGLGRMGIHRNVIHPRFGNFILLTTVISELELDAADQSRPIDYNPCLECRLCVAACPVGAIGTDGRFDFSACFTHNYREFMGGFGDWAEQLAESRGAIDYRSRVEDHETASMWQSLSFGANYKAAYCLAVCPAGEEVIGPFLENRGVFVREVVDPLRKKEETLYVAAGSDAESYAAKRFPHKRRKRIKNGLRPSTIRGFLDALVHIFQRGRSEGLNATYHFVFTGGESAEATVVIQGETIRVEPGLVGRADLWMRADAASWLRFVRKEGGLVGPLLRRKIRLRGNPRLLAAFGRCFP